MFGKKQTNNARFNKTNPGVNIKFGVKSIYFEQSGFLFIRDNNSKNGKLKELRFSIIEPITGIAEVDERLLNMIFLEASIQGYDPVSLISYKDRYFGKDFPFEFNKLNSADELRYYISGTPFPASDKVKIGYAVKVVNASSPKEEPFISLFGFNGFSEYYYPISIDLLSAIFDGVRIKGFIPISLESVIIDGKPIINTDVGVSELNNNEQDKYNSEYLGEPVNDLENGEVIPNHSSWVRTEQLKIYSDSNNSDSNKSEIPSVIRRRNSVNTESIKK